MITVGTDYFIQKASVDSVLYYPGAILGQTYMKALNTNKT